MRALPALVVGIAMLGACSSGDDDADQGTPTTTIATTITTTITTTIAPDETGGASGEIDPTTTTSTGVVVAPSDVSTPPSGDSSVIVVTTTTIPPVVEVPETGVPGLDSDDVFCAAWSRFAGSFQVVAVTAAFGEVPPAQLSALEVAASVAVTEAYDDLLAAWPAELASEEEVVADRFLGPFARRLDVAYQSLVDAGADPATIAQIEAAWIDGLAKRDPSTPEFSIDLPEPTWVVVDAAGDDFSARLVAFSDDPSLITDVSTPLTDEFLATSCPDQGTLAGGEIEVPDP